MNLAVFPCIFSNFSQFAEFLSKLSNLLIRSRKKYKKVNIRIDVCSMILMLSKGLVIELAGANNVEGVIGNSSFNTLQMTTRGIPYVL